jgi:hypothetical protein
MKRWPKKKKEKFSMMWKRVGERDLAVPVAEVLDMINSFDSHLVFDRIDVPIRGLTF